MNPLAQFCVCFCATFIAITIWLIYAAIVRFVDAYDGTRQDKSYANERKWKADWNTRPEVKHP